MPALSKVQNVVNRAAISLIINESLLTDQNIDMSKVSEHFGGYRHNILLLAEIALVANHFAFLLALQLAGQFGVQFLC